MDHLFVYGSLSPGQPNEHILSKIGGTFQEATVIGVLYEEGWGAEIGFPGIIIDSAGELVRGYVFSSVNLNENWELLDAFEGKEYHRKLTTATLKNGNEQSVYIYELVRKT